MTARVLGVRAATTAAGSRVSVPGSAATGTDVADEPLELKRVDLVIGRL